MKSSKLLAMLALAGFCGTSQTQARSQKIEIKRLEKQRVHWEQAYRESKDRVRELDSGITPRSIEAANFGGEEIDSWKLHTGSSDGNWDRAETAIRNCNWNVKRPELIRQRDLEEALMRKAAREMADIDKAIKKKTALSPASPEWGMGEKPQRLLKLAKAPKPPEKSIPSISATYIR
jgi:hypothetical protein